MATKSNSSPGGVFQVIGTLEQIKRAEAKRKKEQRLMFQRIMYGLTIAFVIGLAVFVQVYYHPVTVVEVIHSAYTLKHAFAQDETSIPTYPVLLKTKREFPFPSDELQAFDSMMRLTPVKKSIHAGTDFHKFRREQHSSISSMHESATIPAEDWEPTTVRGGKRAMWVAWEGVDNTTAAPTILYVHGGIGRFVGSSEAYLGFLHQLSLSSGYRVLGPDYALAPESHITDAVEDIISAYLMLTEDMGVPNEQVFIAGDSGGAIVALLAVQAIRDRQLPAPAGCWVMSPQTDLTASSPSIVTNAVRDAVFFKLAPKYKEWSALTAGVENTLPLDSAQVSPHFADWSGLPPLLFSVAESEILLDDTLRSARKAKSQGVQVTLDLHAHVPHAYPVYVNYAPEFDTAFGRGIGFIWDCMGQNDFVFEEE